MTWLKVGNPDDLKENDLKKVTVNGEDVLLIKLSSGVYATSCYCTHESYDLSDGFIDEGKLICPNHFASFRPEDGSVLNNPEGAGSIGPLKSYRTKIESGSLMVEIP